MKSDNEESEDLFGKGPPAGSFMFRDQSLREQALARKTDPIQSHKAAARVNVNKLEKIVVDTLDIYGPSTVKQISRLSGIDKWSISPRMKPLEGKGLVHRYEEGTETVWRLTDDRYP